MTPYSFCVLLIAFMCWAAISATDSFLSCKSEFLNQKAPTQQNKINKKTKPFRMGKYNIVKEVEAE